MQEYEQEAPTNFERGFEPLESLPATWYNTLAKELTKQAQATKSVVDSIYAELSNVITSAGYELSAADTTQLITSLNKLYATPATTSTPGPVTLASNYTDTGDKVVTNSVLRSLLDSVQFTLADRVVTLVIGDVTKTITLPSQSSVTWAEKAGMLTNSASATSGATCDASRNLYAHTLTLS